MCELQIRSVSGCATVAAPGDLRLSVSGCQLGRLSVTLTAASVPILSLSSSDWDGVGMKSESGALFHLLKFEAAFSLTDHLSMKKLRVLLFFSFLLI